MGKTLEQLGELGGDSGGLGGGARGRQCGAAPAGPGWGRTRHTQPIPATHTLQGTAELGSQGSAAAGKWTLKRAKPCLGVRGKARNMPASTRGRAGGG